VAVHTFVFEQKLQPPLKQSVHCSYSEHGQNDWARGFVASKHCCVLSLHPQATLSVQDVQPDKIAQLGQRRPVAMYHEDCRHTLVASVGPTDVPVRHSSEAAHQPQPIFAVQPEQEEFMPEKAVQGSAKTA